MRILVVAAEHPLPADNGLRLHLRHLLTALRRRHEIILVSLLRPGDDTAADAVADLCTRFIGVPEATPSLSDRIARELAALPSRRPILAEQLRRTPLFEAVAAAIAGYRPDVIHVEPGWAAELGIELAGHVPIVMATLDAWHLNWLAEADETADAGRRWRVRREASRMRRFEGSTFATYDAVVVVTEADADALRAINPSLQPVVVTNGVETERFRRPNGDEPTPGLVVFSGAMSYAPNVEAARFASTKVMPAVHAMLPDAHLALVGRDPDPVVQALAGPHTEVTGTVDDVRPYLWRSSAYLCPMRVGTGVKNKLLEALAAGCACVVTPKAAAGLGLTHGREVLMGESADELAALTVRVLEDPALRQELAAHAEARAAELSWDATARGYERIYQDVVDRRTGSGDVVRGETAS